MKGSSVAKMAIASDAMQGNARRLSVAPGVPANQAVRLAAIESLAALSPSLPSMSFSTCRALALPNSGSQHATGSTGTRRLRVERRLPHAHSEHECPGCKVGAVL